MKSARPMNLNLFRIKFPITAIVSILHRISGVVIFLGLPIFMVLLRRSLTSQDSFDKLLVKLAHPEIKILLWVLIMAVVWHLIAGIRHMIMDVGLGESLTAGRTSAYVVIIISILCAILLGVWLCS